MAIEYIRYGIEPNKKYLKELREHPYNYLTFDSAYPISQLKKLRKNLIDSDLISKNITIAQFAAIFRKQFLAGGIKPICWHGSKESLRYFIEQLIPGIIIHKNQVAQCFEDSQHKSILISKPNRTKSLRQDDKILIQKIINSMV